eukprot:936118-Rhodomonas_salina.2
MTLFLSLARQLVHVSEHSLLLIQHLWALTPSSSCIPPPRLKSNSKKPETGLGSGSFLLRINVPVTLQRGRGRQRLVCSSDSAGLVVRAHLSTRATRRTARVLGVLPLRRSGLRVRFLGSCRLR